MRVLEFMPVHVPSIQLNSLHWNARLALNPAYAQPGSCSARFALVVNPSALQQELDHVAACPVLRRRRQAR